MKKCMICVALLVVIVVIGATVCAQGYIHNPANTPSVGGGNASP